MKFKGLFIFICLIICLFSIASVCAIDGVNHTQTIESTQSDEINLTDDLKATEDTDNEIMTAEEGSFEQLNGELQGKTHYTLTRDYRFVLGDDDRFLKGIPLENTITIDGAGHEIDGSGIARIFNVAADNVILKNITFKNGRIGTEGGAVYFASSGSVINCSFADNYATYQGGAIRFSSTGTVTDCNFINNTADRGGAVFFYDDGIIKNSNFSDNSARYSGAVFFLDDGEVVNCNFTGNTAISDDNKGEGGAIIFSKSGAVANCNFVYNTACHYGAIRFDGLSTVTNCNFTENQGNGSTVLFNSFGSLSKCNFVNNLNTEGNGGAICFTLDSECIIENCNFNYNKATGDGGAIWMYFGRLINCNFTDNQATGNGGAVYFYEQGTVTNCNFANNQVMSHDVYNGFGGAIYFSKNSNGNVANCNFTGNNASKGGAICFDEDSTCSVINCNFTGNNVEWDGGAICFMDSGNVTNCNFANNCALRYGGAVYIYSSGSVVNSDFKNNTGDEGGAIMFYDEGCVENSSLTNNKATFQGGAIYFHREGEATNCNFINNSAIDTGGAIYFSGKGNVSKSNFTDNTAKDGGAIYFRDIGNVTDCNFINNNVSKYGGAINFDYIASIVSNCSFINNSAEYGGAINFQLENIVSNCIFADNSAEYGGAVNFFTSGTAINCNFTSNSAINQGGAVYLNDGNVTKCNFINNTAVMGGAIHVYSGSVEGCNFTDNSAEYGGAVTFNYDGSGDLTNCNFTNNTAKKNGGGVYFDEYSNGVLEICNFANNHASSGCTIFSYDNEAATADTCILKTDSNSTYQVRILPPTLNVDNFMSVYNSSENLTFDLKTNSGKPAYNRNISISVYYKNNNSWIANYSFLSNEEWTVDLPVGSYYAIFDTEYAKFEPVNITIKILPDIPFYANVTPVTTNNRTVNITAKSNIPNEIIEGELLFVLDNGTEISANYNADGTWWAEYTFEDYCDYNVNASYIGFSNITVNNATISILKADSRVTIYPIDNVTYGKDAIITYTVENKTTISAVVKDIQGSEITEGIDTSVEGTVTVSGLDIGTYTITITNAAEGKYNSSSAEAEFNVIDKSNVEFTKAKGHPGRVDQNATVEVILSQSDATGTVSINIDGVDYSTELVEGKAVIYAPLLPAGTYNADVVYSGDENYKNNTAPVTFNVNKYYPTMKATASSVRADENATVNVALPSDATGTVTITVDSMDYTADVVDGTAAVVLPVISQAGPQTFNVTYSGDDKYRTYTTSVEFNVLKCNTKIKATARTVKLGNNVTVNVALPSDATGEVSLDINGTAYIGTVEDGAAAIIIPDLGVGQYALTVDYSGDDKYKPANTTVTFNVNKQSTTMKATARTVKVGDNITVNVKLASDATGEVIINVDGTDYTATAENGIATIVIPDLAYGQYALNVQYRGDGKYKAINTTVTFNVNKQSTTMKATARTVKVGDNVTVNVKLASDATGDVVITVDGFEYTATVENGIAAIVLSDLPADQYSLAVKYSGDNKYKNQSTTVKFNVNKYNVRMKVTAKYDSDDDYATISAKLSDDATGSISTEVNGNNYTVNLVDGEALIHIPNLPAGEYTLDVAYSGDAKYKEYTAITTLNV